MKQVKVLGSGCRNCEITANIIAQAAKDAGVEVEIEKVTDIAAIMAYGVISTPGVVVDGKVVHTGAGSGAYLGCGVTRDDQCPVRLRRQHLPFPDGGRLPRASIDEEKTICKLDVKS